ncbi:MAG TPA: MMPL family transporter [Solirubrobacteraceae bacterium]|nr:MMPL family transporter [Solirubrobacteraceae bacterium]
MVALSRWCIAHRRVVVVGWIVIAVATTVVAGGVGRHYANNFTLPGTEAQRVIDVLNHQFRAQSGDIDTIVIHSARHPVTYPPVAAAFDRLLARVRRMPYVVSVTGPFSVVGNGGGGSVQISRDGHTAFATVNYAKRANLLPNTAGSPVIRAVNAFRIPGVQVAAGGQVIESAQGFSIGPATTVGVVAALIILLLTFGSLSAAGMPLFTAALGLITGISLVGLATHVISTPQVSTDLALMIGLGVGVDYALFIVTRFRESHARTGNVERSIIEAMDTSGRAILLAGTTVIIALLGMFATGVAFMYGLAIASVLAVLCVLLASLTVLPALLSMLGARIVRPGRRARRRAAEGRAHPESAWRRWSVLVQSRPWPLVIASLLVMLVFLVPVFSMRLLSSDAGNDPANTTTYRAFHLLARGFGPGFNGPLLVTAQLSRPGAAAQLPALRATLARTPNVGGVTPPRLAPSGRVAVLEVYPRSAPQDQATVNLVKHLRTSVLVPFRDTLGSRPLVGGFTAGSIDFAAVLAGKLPLFIGIVVVVSALLLFVIFRSLVIPVQAALMNLISIGGALGVTVAVFQNGWLAGVIGVTPGPVEPWIPVLMFAVVFGLSMDYEVFLISRVREEWVRRGDASRAVADGIAYTGRVISAAAAIMVCVFLSFLLGNERSIKEFGFGLAVAVFLDALVIRCVLLPAVLELLGRRTWWLPRALDARLPQVRIEGHMVADEAPPEQPAAEPAAARRPTAASRSR